MTEVTQRPHRTIDYHFYLLQLYQYKKVSLRLIIKAYAISGLKKLTILLHLMDYVHRKKIKCEVKKNSESMINDNKVYLQ